MAKLPRDKIRRPHPDGGSTSFNALAFSTLLSSQETDAHHCGGYFKLPGKLFPVKSAVPIKAVPI
jgi:hypothetical protein